MESSLHTVPTFRRTQIRNRRRVACVIDHAALVTFKAHIVPLTFRFCLLIPTSTHRPNTMDDWFDYDAMEPTIKRERDSDDEELDEPVVVQPVKKKAKK